MNENSENKKNEAGSRSSEVQMRMALHDIIRLVEGWVDSDERKAEATMLQILNTALKAV